MSSWVGWVRITEMQNAYKSRVCAHFQTMLCLASLHMFTQNECANSWFRVIAHRVFIFTSHMFRTPDFRAPSSL